MTDADPFVYIICWFLFSLSEESLIHFSMWKHPTFYIGTGFNTRTVLYVDYYLSSGGVNH